MLLESEARNKHGYSALNIKGNKLCIYKGGGMTDVIVYWNTMVAYVTMDWLWPIL